MNSQLIMLKLSNVIRKLSNGNNMRNKINPRITTPFALSQNKFHTSNYTSFLKSKFDNKETNKRETLSRMITYGIHNNKKKDLSTSSTVLSDVKVNPFTSEQDLGGKEEILITSKQFFELSQSQKRAEIELTNLAKYFEERKIKEAQAAKIDLTFSVGLIVGIIIFFIHSYITY